MLRKILLIAVVLLAAAIAGYLWLTRPLPILTLMTWPGEYTRAQATAMARPYGGDKRVDVRIAQYNGGLKELTQAVRSHQYHGDVIDMELPDAAAACLQGLLEPMEHKTLPPGKDGRAADMDFVPGALGPCWIGSVVYSQAIMFAPGQFAGDQPSTLDDFFDTVTFPGMRALNRSSAKYNLEMALLADGVPPQAIYTTLSSPAGIERALQKLATLKPNLIWYNTAREAARLVQTGGAAFATALNGDIFAARAAKPGIIWDRQVYELDVFAVPKGNPRKDMAMDFIRYATGTDRLAAVATWVPYGPARRSAFGLVGNNPDLGIAMAPWLPTTRFDRAFAIDATWWHIHGSTVAARWQAWLNTDITAP